LKAWDEAAGAYERALALRRTRSRPDATSPSCWAVLGRIGEAEAHHRRLALNPATPPLGADAAALLRPGAIGGRRSG